MGWRKIAEAATSEASALAPFRVYVGRIWDPGLHKAVGCFLDLIGELAMDCYHRFLDLVGELAMDCHRHA